MLYRFKLLNPVVLWALPKEGNSLRDGAVSMLRSKLRFQNLVSEASDWYKDINLLCTEDLQINMSFSSGQVIYMSGLILENI